MNLRHAAALALVGWYLMMPPVTPDGRVQKSAPLSTWEITSSYDTADDCEKVRLVSSGWMANSNGQKREHTPRADAEACVSTDDPRLKEK
ncbi:hypothetical protein [Candidatus Binatus sp.]|uniref:hypothetical protein n=1 Tax=Candidatus Binatus sp. TaxID=2811406 RepID=UPI003CC5AD44